MNFDEIKELIEIFNQSDASKLQISKDEFSIKLEKPTASAPLQVPAYATPAAPLALPQAPCVPEAPRASESSNSSGEAITSPMVGTFYRCPSPDAPAYVNVGDKVKKGQTLGIIEAMKIMNEIEAEFDCKILEIVPSDSQPVEYNSKLFIVERI
ncbi:acetyl-CoA carboxylase biotin carboxyl carrier protein [Wolinella succinogenes]|uniref:acetyl-CoA carboxylase biotin carboxyl carrier protein n=1 Tax=Wolinella succinogenes TaxID=844 RepID=UPI002FC66781